MRIISYAVEQTGCAPTEFFLGAEGTDASAGSAICIGLIDQMIDKR